MPSLERAGRIIAAILFAALTATAAAAQDPSWQVSRVTTEIIVALLGVPETDDVRIRVACDPANRFNLTLSAFYHTPHPETRTPAMAFTVDGTQFIRGMRFGPFDEFYGGYEAEVVIAHDDPLITAMKAGTTFSATLHPASAAYTTVTISLAGSSAAIEDLLQQCGHERS